MQHTEKAKRLLLLNVKPAVKGSIEIRNDQSCNWLTSFNYIFFIGILVLIKTHYVKKMLKLRVFSQSFIPLITVSSKKYQLMNMK